MVRVPPVAASATAGSEVESAIVPLTLKVMTSFARVPSAFEIASRSEPLPLSPRDETV